MVDCRKTPLRVSKLEPPALTKIQNTNNNPNGTTSWQRRAKLKALWGKYNTLEKLGITQLLRLR